MPTLDTSAEKKMKECILDGDIEGVRALLDAGYDLETRFEGGSGCAALSLAAQYHLVELVELFLARGARVDARDDTGHTALHHVTRDGSRAAMEALLAAGADPNAVSAVGRTPLHLALALGSFNGCKLEGDDRLKLLLVAGADPDYEAICSDPEMQEIYLTPLQAAFKRRNVEAAHMLADYAKSSPDQLSANGRSLAALSKQDARLEALRESMRAVYEVEDALGQLPANESAPARAVRAPGPSPL
jgi:ankyrin repeat protein